jgi:hypothetical protein
MRLATILAVGLAVQAAASGGTITISGSGTWDGTVSSSSGLSAPGATWSFSFDVPDPLVNKSRTDVTDAWYALNGTPVHDTIASVEFYGSSAGGLFDMTFASGGTVAFYGAQIEETANGLIPRTYSTTLDDDHARSFLGPPYGEGRGILIVGSGGPGPPTPRGSSVPEPSTLVGSSIALATLAGLGLARRRRIAARSRSR